MPDPGYVQFVTVTSEDPRLPKPTRDATAAGILVPHEQDPNPHSAYDNAPDFAATVRNILA